MSGRTVLLLAGEPSGDLHGGALAVELARRRPDLRLVGTGGAHMRAAGVELLAGLEELAVMGFAEVVARLASLRRIERRLRRVLSAGDVGLVVPIDYPGLNMRVARLAAGRHIPVLYYIPPKVWAWREGRARALAADTDRVAAVLPFETELLLEHGVRATFVGHPLLDRREPVADAPAFRAAWRLDPERPLLAVLPGSRRQELGRHLQPFIEAADLVCASRPDVLPVLGRARSLSPELFARLPYPVVDDVRGLLHNARAALLKSGTVTLEAALEGTPSVVAYRTSRTTWALARRLLRVDHVALPNLIADRPVVPELLQDDATPQALAAALLPLLDASDARRRQVEDLELVRSRLGTPGASGRVAEMAMELLEEAG